MEDSHKKSLLQKWTAFFKPKTAQVEQTLQEVKDRGEEVQRAILERRMQERARKGIHLGGFTVPDSWRDLTLANLREVYERSRLEDGAGNLTDKDWGLLQYAGRAFAEDGRTLLGADIDALSTLRVEPETEASISLLTMFERVQERARHMETILVNTLKVKGKN